MASNWFVVKNNNSIINTCKYIGLNGECVVFFGQHKCFPWSHIFSHLYFITLPLLDVLLLFQLLLINLLFFVYFLMNWTLFFRRHSLNCQSFLLIHILNDLRRQRQKNTERITTNAFLQGNLVRKKTRWHIPLTTTKNTKLLNKSSSFLKSHSTVLFIRWMSLNES